MLVKKELLCIQPTAMPKKTTNADVLVTVDIYDLPKSGRVLVADMYKKRDGKLMCRFFSDGVGYYTYYGWPEGSWKKSNPAIAGYYGYFSAYSSKADNEKTEQFFGIEERRCWRSSGALAVIGSFVDEKMDEKKLRAMDAREALRKRHFNMFPPLPEDLEGYCEENVFGKTYLFFGALGKKKYREVKCGHCSSIHTAPREIKAGDLGRCPICGMPGEFKAIWRTEYIGESTRICIAARVDDQLLIRWLDVCRGFIGKNRMERRYDFSEYGYNLYLTDKNGKQTIYDYALVTAPYTNERSWKRYKNGCQNFSKSYIYVRNLREVFGERYYNVDLQRGLEGRRIKVSFTELLNNLKNIPEAEYLFKLGMPVLAANADRLPNIRNKTGGRFQAVMGVSKQFAPMYAEMDVTMEEHRLIRNYGKWVTPGELVALRALKPKDGDYGAAQELLKEMSIGKFLRYFSKQRAVSKNTLSHLMLKYRDYISMAKQLNLELSRKTVRFPEDVGQAHDALVEEINRIEYEEQNETFIQAVEKLYERLACREWEKDGYRIVLPQLRTDLIREGKSLHHCVGGDNYYKKHIRGESMIVFIRKAEERDRPFVTMEVDMKAMRIIQIYGFGDRPPNGEVRKFAESYVRALKAGANYQKGRKTA